MRFRLVDHRGHHTILDSFSVAPLDFTNESLNTEAPSVQSQLLYWFGTAMGDTDKTGTMGAESTLGPGAQ